MYNLFISELLFKFHFMILNACYYIGFFLYLFQEFSQKLQSKQSALTSVTEKMNKLTQGQESPEHKEIGELSNQWLDLCLKAHNLLMQREEDLQRTRDYHDRMNVVEVFLEKLTKEWDNLAR